MRPLRAGMVAAAVLRSAPSRTATQQGAGSRVHAAPIAAASSCSSGGLPLREHGARLIAGADFGHVDQLRSLGVNAAARASWINQTDTCKCDTRVRALFLDGLTFDFGKRASAGKYRGAVLHPDREGDHGCDARRGAFVRTSPLPCVEPSPCCVARPRSCCCSLRQPNPALLDRYVMGYDTRSQIFDECIASAKAALPVLRKGLQTYLDLGIPPHQLVMGVPWYGYNSIRAHGGDGAG